jgi:hypothetical protein
MARKIWREMDTEKISREHWRAQQSLTYLNIQLINTIDPSIHHGFQRNNWARLCHPRRIMLWKLWRTDER